MNVKTPREIIGKSPIDTKLAVKNQLGTNSHGGSVTRSLARKQKSSLTGVLVNNDNMSVRSRTNLLVSNSKSNKEGVKLDVPSHAPQPMPQNKSSTTTKLYEIMLQK